MTQRQQTRRQNTVHLVGASAVVGDVDISLLDHFRDLAVMLNSLLTMKQPADTIARSCFYQMQQLRSVCRSLTFDTLHTLVQVLINSKVDHCNAVLYSTPAYAVRHLQVVLNATVHLVTGTRPNKHIAWYFVTRCTGCQSLSALSTRLCWRPTATSIVRVLRTTTASVVQLHLSRDVRCWGQPTLENLLSQEREESTMIHTASVSSHHLFGTTYYDAYTMVTLTVNNSLAIWKHFCLHGPIRQWHLWECLYKTRSINGLTFLLTYKTTHVSCTVPIQYWVQRTFQYKDQWWWANWTQALYLSIQAQTCITLHATDTINYKHWKWNV